MCLFDPSPRLPAFPSPRLRSAEARVWSLIGFNSWICPLFYVWYLFVGSRTIMVVANFQDITPWPPWEMLNKTNRRLECVDTALRNFIAASLSVYSTQRKINSQYLHDIVLFFHVGTSMFIDNCLIVGWYCDFLFICVALFYYSTVLRD